MHNHQALSKKRFRHAIRQWRTSITVVALILLVGGGISYFIDTMKLPKVNACSTSSTSLQSSSNLSTSTKVIYFTFDMDMNEVMYQKYLAHSTLWYNPELFTYLQKNQIPSTFFVSGLFVQAYPQLIKNLSENPEFSFENHAYNESSFVPHCYWLTTLTTNIQKIQQIRQTEDLIEKSTGQTPTYFRYPGVCHNAINDALIHGMGFIVNDGSIIAGDPFSTNTPVMVRTILSQATTSAVVLMHIGGPNAPESLTVLEQVIPKLRSDGYVFGVL